MSPNDIAMAMGRGLGRRVKYRDISERMMTKALKALPPSNYSEAAVSQLAIYAEEYRRGTFAVYAPTSDVREVGRREPEGFENIVRRVVAARPDLSRSFARSLGALGGFMKILATSPLNPTLIEEQRDYVRLSKPVLSQD